MGPPPDLMRDLRRFRARLQKTVGDVHALVLFGSQATGRAGPDSDVDVMIVSRAFKGKDYFDRGLLARRAWDLPRAVDFLCYTPEEFDRLRKQVTIVRAVMEEGVAVEG
ncbi:MAG: nucleotidyltransferase domain-containing protein [Methanobacteriota archaeon]